MKQKRSRVLDEKDDKAVELFAELGMPKNLAKTLMYISQVDECKSADVEQGADLRQPEVSVAMQEMRRMVSGYCEAPSRIEPMKMTLSFFIWKKVDTGGCFGMIRLCSASHLVMGVRSQNVSCALRLLHCEQKILINQTNQKILGKRRIT